MYFLLVFGEGGEAQEVENKQMVPTLLPLKLKHSSVQCLETLLSSRFLLIKNKFVYF